WGLEKRDAALVPGRGPRVLPFAIVARERRREGRQQALEVTSYRGRRSAGDERRCVLEQPDELIRQGGHLHRDPLGQLSVRHEKDGDPGVAGPEASEQLGGLRMGAAVVLAQRPVYEDAMEARIGAHVRETVLTGIGFDHFDSARS